MTSKCWFVLRHHHYPPPTFNKSGSKQTGGPLRLGHIIPDLQHLDNVINTRNGPLETPPDMPIYSTKSWNLTWNIDHVRDWNLSVNAGVPIAAAAGITIKAGAGVAFQHTVQNFWEFESLDTYIIQPISEYVEDSLEDEQVASYLHKHKRIVTPSVFMITGLIIARGASVKSSMTDGTDIYGGPGIELPTIVELGSEIGKKNEISISSTAKRVSDFVWAVRLAKISKGLLDRTWSHQTFTKGAIFGLDDEQDQGELIRQTMRKEGLGDDFYLNLEDDGTTFVVQSSG
ncbi:hypothetical protein G7054_g9334 [Neopestalotiopsis clavispora]|nr:hypothetical protein G7054_g9334 [Neopestalotiopsis clavispora]